MISRFAFALVILCPMLSLHGDPRQHDASVRPVKLASAVDRLIGWLPKDTETLVVSQEPFQIPDLFSQKSFKNVVQRSPTFIYLLFGKRHGLRQLSLETITIAVSGCRRFRVPTDGGPTLFEGCSIVQFEEASTNEVQTVFKSYLEEADRIDELAGQKVGFFKERFLPGTDEWTFYLANPKPGILICATDRAFLQRVLNRSDGKGAGRAFPDSLPEWQHLDVRAPVWGMRHYRMQDAINDPTSPLGPPKNANVPDPQAIGFVFWYDDNPESAHSMTARYFSNSPDALQIAMESWKGEKEGLAPKFSQVDPAIVEMSLTHDEIDGQKLFHSALRDHLGHVLYDRRTR